jgi:hypothetical protein
VTHLQTQAEANVYWSAREHKKWTVTLTGQKRTVSVRGRDGEWTHRREAGVVTMYVTAGSAERAIACAVANCHAPQRWASKTARLATAQDLGCVRAQPSEQS